MAEAAHLNALRIMAAFELNKRLAGSGVDVFSCHPGVSKTEVLRSSTSIAHNIVCSCICSEGWR